MSEPVVIHRRRAAASKSDSDYTDQATQLTKPFGDDQALNVWAARMLAAADEVQNKKRPDPLGSFI